jgi:chemotaxis protein histidine kinase CheA
MWLAKLLRKYPIKSITIIIAIVILSAVGLSNIFMATGNDTLVESSSDVYQDNLMLEEEFGGETIMVLYESDDLLTPDHLEHMKGLENVLEMNNSIYSIVSPVTLVEAIANNQSEAFQDGILEIIDGLNEMGSQLEDIGSELKENAESDPGMDFPALNEPELPEMEGPELPEFGVEFPGMDDPSFPELAEIDSPGLGFDLPELGDIEMPDMENQMDELNQGFLNMIGAQQQLGNGTEGLVEGYAEFSERLNGLGQSLNELVENMEDSPERDQLQERSQELIGISEQMSQISEETDQLPRIPVQTIEGLSNMQQNLNEQLQQQKELQEQVQDQMQKQEEMQALQQAQQEQVQQEMKEQQEQMKQKMQEQQAAQQEEMQREMEAQQEFQKGEMREEMQQQQDAQQEEMQEKMEIQQAEREAEMQDFQDEMEEKQAEQTEMLSTLGDGLVEMGENLQSISENIDTMYGYSDIVTPGLPESQDTLDNMIYDDDDELRPMFEEVVVDESYMLMMIRLEGETDDVDKGEVVNEINTYFEIEEIETADTLVSGKPVLDNEIRSSMQESIQKMMATALIIMVVVLFVVFRVRWSLLPLVIVFIAVIGTVGLMGWMSVPITMVSMAVFPILIGLGTDYGIQFQNRYAEELTKEDSHE